MKTAQVMIRRVLQAATTIISVVILNGLYIGCGSASSGGSSAMTNGSTNESGAGSGGAVDNSNPNTPVVWSQPSPGPLVKAIDANNLSSNSGFFLIGENANEQAGHSVAMLGDINGDGFSDIAIGAPGVDNTNSVGTAEGEVYLVMGGKIHPATGGLFKDLNGSNGGFRLGGGLASGAAGYRLSNAGDQNGDGLSDLLISEPKLTSTTSAAHVLLGRTLQSFTLFNQLNLDLLNPSGSSPFNAGYRMASPTGFSGIGLYLDGGGDFNGDGFSDLVMTVPSAGQTFISFGKPTGLANIQLSASISSSTAINLRLSNSLDGFGAVGFAGDVDRDGFQDLLVGLPGFFSGDDGRVALMFGSSTPTTIDNLDLSTLVSSQSAIVLSGPAGGGELGRENVVGVGDINGDGYSDFALLAPAAKPGGRIRAGSIYIVFGNPSRTALSALDLASLDGLNGFRIDGGSSGSSSTMSLQVAGAGDLNGDGLDDLIVGDPGYTNAQGAGRAYVIFGSRASFVGINGINLNTMIDGVTDLNGDGKPDGIKISGPSSFGRAVAGGRDINGDGYDDLVIGAFQYTLPGTFITTGAAYIIYGGDFRSELTSVTNGANILMGSAGSETIDGLGGADVIHAGAGNDTVMFYGDETLIDGGGDSLVSSASTFGDTIQFAKSQTLDLKVLSGRRKLKNIETLDMHGTNSTIKIDVDGAQGLSASNRIFILGEGSDVVNIVSGGFSMQGPQFVNGKNFHCYSATGKKITLCIQDGVVVLP